MGKISKEQRRANREASRNSMVEVIKADSTKKKSSSYLNLPSGIEKYIPKEGRCIFDIVGYDCTVPCNVSNPVQAISDPKKVGDDLKHGRPYLRHNVGGKSVVCPTTVGKDCPICEEQFKLSKNYDENEETIKKIKGKTRYLYNIHIDGVFSVLDISNFYFEKKLREDLKSMDEDFQDFHYPEETEELGGYTFKTSFLETEYEKTYKLGRVDFVNREVPINTEGMADLNDIFVIESYDNLVKLLHASQEEEEEDYEVVEDEKEEVEETQTRRSPADKKVVEKEDDLVVENPPVEEDWKEETKSDEDEDWG